MGSPFWVIVLGFSIEFSLHPSENILSDFFFPSLKLGLLLMSRGFILLASKIRVIESNFLVDCYLSTCSRVFGVRGTKLICWLLLKLGSHGLSLQVIPVPGVEHAHKFLFLFTGLLLHDRLIVPFTEQSGMEYLSAQEVRLPIKKWWIIKEK